MSKDSSKNQSPTPSKRPIWIVEDNIAYREAVAMALDQSATLRCGRQFNAAEPLIAALQKSGETERPAAILLDIQLLGINGLDALPEIHKAAPETPVIVLSVFEDDAKIFTAICRGAIGYLLKTSSTDRITPAIEEAMAGGSPLSPRIAKRALALFAELNKKEGATTLNPTELQILKLLAKGFYYKEIGEKLGMSFGGVNYHTNNIYKKLHVKSRSEAVAKALKHKMV